MNAKTTKLPRGADHHILLLKNGQGVVDGDVLNREFGGQGRYSGQSFLHTLACKNDRALAQQVQIPDDLIRENLCQKPRRGDFVALSSNPFPRLWTNNHTRITWAQPEEE